MTRLEYIVKNAKGVLKDTFNFRQRKIERTVEDSLDYADEKAYDAELKAVEIINSIKDIADDKAQITRKLNEYIDKMEEAEGYRRSKKYLEKVQELLKEEIEVEDTEDKK